MFEEALWEPTEDKFEAQVACGGDLIDVNALGVEGIHCDRDEAGYTRVIYYSNGKVFSISSPDDVERWLSSEDEELLFTVDKCFLDSLLKWFGESAIKEAMELTLKGYELRVGGVRIRDYRGGRFTVYRGSRVAKRVLSLIPFYHMSFMLSEREDCYSIKDKAARLLRTLKAYDIPAVNFLSVGGLFQGYIVREGLVLSSPPRYVQQMAANAYHTQWVVAHKVGYFGRAYDYDLNSAFAYEAANLLSCSSKYGKWVRSSEYQPSAAYGFCYATISIVSTDGAIPLLQRAACGTDSVGNRVVVQFNRVGQYRGFVEKAEVDLIEQYHLGRVEIHDGWWFLPEVEVYPFRKVIEKTFELRASARSRGDEFAANLAKLLGVQAQGKFLSRFYSRGKLTKGYMYNPVYAAAITSRVRCRLYRYLANISPRAILHIGVDGFTLTEKLPLPDEKTNAPGLLRLNSPTDGEECIVVADGEYWVPSRRSVLQKRTLEEYRKCSYYPDLSRLGLYTMWSGSFYHIGLPRSKGRLMEFWSLQKSCHRDFPVFPETCEDVLTKQYESVPLFLPKRRLAR